MKVEINRIASLLNVVEYSDIETSISELMEKICKTIERNYISDLKKKTGNWTWSVFSVNDKMIEQRASGGINSNLRKSVVRREATRGMIARIISKNEFSKYIYEKDVTKLSKTEYFKVIDITKSAIVYKVSRQHDVVGVINIESDKLNDFDDDIVSEYLEYTSKILSSVLLIDKHRNIINKYETMFNRTINVMKDHETISLQPFYKDIVELFRIQNRLDGVLLFSCKDKDDIKLLSTSNTFQLVPNNRVKKDTNYNKSILIKTLKSSNYSPVSKTNIDVNDLLSFEKEQEKKNLEYVRLYRTSYGETYNFILVAISHNQYNPPNYVEYKSFENLLKSTLNAFVSLERERLEKEKNVLTNALYKLSYKDKNHTSFIDNAVKLISEHINSKSCILIVYRKLEKPAHIKNDGLSKDIEIVSYIDSDYMNTVVNKNKLLKTVDYNIHSNIYYSIDDECLYQKDHHQLYIMMNNDEISTSGHKLALCVVDEQVSSERICTELSNINNEKYLESILNELYRSLNTINMSLVNSDTIEGFSIIHNNNSFIESSKSFDDIVIALHKIYGTIYESGSNKTLSGTLNTLKGSYLSIYKVRSNDIIMTRTSQIVSKLPKNPPSFKKGMGLTGNILKEENGEKFVPMVEASDTANIDCKSYWNQVLSTHARYFYGKVFRFQNKTGIISIVGKRTSHFQEQVFSTTIRSIFDVLVDIIHASGERCNLPSIDVTWPEITHKILSDHSAKDRNVFLMIRYLDHDKYSNLRKRIRKILLKYDLTLLIADEKKYNKNLGVNLEAYMDASKYFIAVIDDVPINANISYEMGYMHTKSNNSLVLKDKSVKEMNADFKQLLFEEIDLNKLSSIDSIIEKWASNLVRID